MSKSLEEFLQRSEGRPYDPTEAMFGAVGNKTLGARYAIIQHLVEVGADASSVRDGNSMINSLLGQADNEPAGLATTFATLIEAGADVNHPDGRHRRPPLVAVAVGPIPDADAAPIYDVLLGAPALDLDQPYSFGAFDGTVREYVLASGGRSSLQERMPR